jgi:hypothetical protein
VIFRKRKRDRGDDQGDRRLRRRDRETDKVETNPTQDDEETRPAPQRRHGPYDAAEVEMPDDPASVGRVDLGGLQIPAMEGIELRLQIDQASQTVVAALLVRGDSALELRAFAAPRSTGIWDEIRKEIAVETTRRGGVATEAIGPFGPEIKVVLPTRTPDGRQVTQTSRIVGVDGPRWFLRGTLIGRAATDPAVAGPLLHAMSHVVVVRGKAPMAPRDMIPLRIPEAARAQVLQQRA